MGFEVDGQAQVSMNLVDTEKTPLHVAFDMVSIEAEARGVTPTWSEIVGLVPERALLRRRGAAHPPAQLHAARWCSSTRCARPSRAASR